MEDEREGWGVEVEGMALILGQVVSNTLGGMRGGGGGMEGVVEGKWGRERGRGNGRRRAWRLSWARWSVTPFRGVEGWGGEGRGGGEHLKEEGSPAPPLFPIRP